MDLHIELDTRTNLKDLVKFLRTNMIRIKAIEHNPAYSSSGLSVYSISIELEKNNKKTHQNVIDEIKELEYVNYVEENF